jgi:hypothetical protein
MDSIYFFDTARVVNELRRELLGQGAQMAISGLKFSTTMRVSAGLLNEAESKFKSAHRFENIGHGATPPRTPITSCTPPAKGANKLTAESSSTKIAMRMQPTEIYS